jgi:hypothetical protein
MTGVATLTVILVLVPLIAIFGYLVYRGIGSINWAFLTQTPKPVGEPGGGMANAIVGSASILMIASVVGVPVGVGAGIYRRRSERRAFDCDWYRCVFNCSIATKAFFGARGRGGVGYHDDPHDHPHHGRNVASGAPGATRGGLWTGHPTLANRTLDYAANGYFRSAYRRHVSFRARRGRNRAIAVHGFWKSVLEPAD